MKLVNGKDAKTSFLAALLACAFLAALQMPARAQPDRSDSSGSIFEAIARGLSRVGEKTRELVAPSFSPLGGMDAVDYSDMVQAPREFDDSVEVRPGVVISVSNELGEVRVRSWDNPVVRVHADILIGAESYEQAQEIAKAVNIDVKATENHVDVRAIHPDTRDMGRVVKTVNYLITVPPDASIDCKNSFGDTIIHDVDGAVGIDSRFGVVDLRNLGGPARVRAHGEFPLQAYGLREGGTFVLWGTHAEFGDISKSLNVSSFFGPVTMRDLGAEIEAQVANDSGSIHLLLNEDTTPDLETSVWFGSLASDVALNPVSTGNITYGRSPNRESGQRIALRAAFGDIRIERRVETGDQPPDAAAQGELTENTVEEDRTFTEGRTIEVDAIVGDITFEGVDENLLRIKAKRVVRVLSRTNARAAVEALDLELQELDDRLVIKTTVRDDLQSLGCTQYRFDVAIECPRVVPLRIKAQNGQTVVRGMGAPVFVEQVEGSVLVEHVKGPLELVTQKGGVSVFECAGPVTITARGDVDTRNVYGAQIIEGRGGKTVVDAPRAELKVQQVGGDVYVIPLDGIHGNYDMIAEGGDVNILIPESADATILATTRNGTVQSAFTLTGEKSRGYERFQGRRKEGIPGKYQVVLETIDGDIIID